MYANARLSGSLAGIDSINISMYWNAVKDRLGDLRQLPTWCTNHAMKLGIAVTNLKAKGRPDLVALLEDEIRKVNDDIVRAWKVKGYVDKYAPEWLVAAQQAAAGPVVASTTTPVTPTVSPSIPTPSNTIQPYQQKTLTQEVTGWVSSWFGGGGVQGAPLPEPYVSGLGALPIILGAAALAALAYCVTTGMAIYQDYVTKKDLTQAVIEGKLSSGQAAEIIVAARPPESAISNVLTGVGTNVGTLLVVGGLGYLAFMYFTTKGAAKAIA